jgi:hypothetical protein
MRQEEAPVQKADQYIIVDIVGLPSPEVPGFCAPDTEPTIDRVCKIRADNQWLPTR